MHCKYCGKDVPQLESKRARMYCSDSHKQLAYRRRKHMPQVEHGDDRAEVAELRAQVADQAQEIEEKDRIIADLRVRLDYEERYLTDIGPHAFKSWLKKQPSSPWRDRFLSDQFIQEGKGKSRSYYEAQLWRLHRTDEEYEDFVRVWKLMLLSGK